MKPKPEPKYPVSIMLSEKLRDFAMDNGGHTKLITRLLEAEYARLHGDTEGTS